MIVNHKTNTTIFSCIFFLLFLIDTIKPNLENKIKNFMRLFKGGKLGGYKIKPVLFLFVLGLLAATKTLFKKNKKIYI